MITCQKCGLVDDFRIITKSNNQMAYCNGCDSFIKNIPHDEPKLYVGKYKNKAIKDIDDLKYLEWAQREMKLSSNIRDAINRQIEHLKYLMK